MANHVDNGDEVHLVFLTKGENITNMDGSPDELIARRKAHTDKIQNLLGVQVHFMDFPDSRIEMTMEGGYKVATMLRKFKPDIVITDREDGTNGHPDHVNAHKLAMAATKYCRFKDPHTDLPPHRAPMNVYTPARLEKYRGMKQCLWMYHISIRKSWILSRFTKKHMDFHIWTKFLIIC